MDRIFDNPIVAVFVPVVIYIIMFTIDERVLQVWLENVWMFPMFFVSIGLGVVLIVRRRRE